LDARLAVCRKAPTSVARCEELNAAAPTADYESEFIVALAAVNLLPREAGGALSGSAVRCSPTAGRPGGRWHEPGQVLGS